MAEMLEQIPVVLSESTLKKLESRLLALGYPTGSDGIERFLSDFAAGKVEQSSQDPAAKIGEWMRENPEKVKALGNFAFNFLTKGKKTPGK